MLVGEQLPTEGSIWKAQGLRLAYVAQHAFHHLEKHMQELKTMENNGKFVENGGKSPKHSEKQSKTARTRLDTP